MLRVCFFPLPQGGRRDEWAGADRTNGNHHRVAVKVVSKIERGRPATSVHGFVLAVFVLVLDRSSNCIILSWSTR
jgi:hypothetical protein